MKLKLPTGNELGIDVEICAGPYREVRVIGGTSIAWYDCACCGLRQRDMEDHVHPSPHEWETDSAGVRWCRAHRTDHEEDGRAGEP